MSASATATAKKAALVKLLDADAVEAPDYLNIVDLGEIMRNGVPPVEMLVPRRLVRGTSNVYFGPKSYGKTWAATNDAAAVLDEGGTVVWVDKEQGRSQTARNLETLGLDPDVISARFVYCEFPTLDCSDESVAAWTELLVEREPELIIVDAFSGVLIDGGLNEDRTPDVLTWEGAYFTPARKLGLTTLMLDHVGHEPQGRRRGASGKGQSAKAELEFELLQPFDRETIGHLQLTCRKNTLAADIPAVHAYRLGGDGHGGFVFEETDPLATLPNSSELERRRDDDIRETLLDELLEAGTDGCSPTYLRSVVTGGNTRVARLLNQLVRNPSYGVRVRSGARKGTSNYYIEPEAAVTTTAPPGEEF